MKFFTVILSVYILGLSLVTCNDDTCDDDIITGDEITFTQKNNQHSGEIDLCSSFCSCQCCQISINTVNLLAYDLLSEDVFSPIFSYHNNRLQSVSNSLFQPPRV
ncbi:hypothetical protein GTQ40_03395 [Flavobacteriaceae bacterium R38]|nr:hypothetical protein [Flavobacteriaceae bacterium R38]